MEVWIRKIVLIGRESYKQKRITRSEEFIFQLKINSSFLVILLNENDEKYFELKLKYPIGKKEVGRKWLNFRPLTKIFAN